MEDRKEERRFPFTFFGNFIFNFLNFVPAFRLTLMLL